MFDRIKLFKTETERYAEARGGIVTLSDEGIATLHFLSEKTVTDDLVKLAEAVPEDLHKLLQKLSWARTERGPFFTHLVAYTREPVDGLLVGFGSDDLYYILGAWEWGESASWEIEKDAFGNEILFEEPELAPELET